MLAPALKTVTTHGLVFKSAEGRDGESIPWRASETTSTT
jgi:hypothetical protein